MSSIIEANYSLSNVVSMFKPTSGYKYMNYPKVVKCGSHTAYAFMNSLKSKYSSCNNSIISLINILYNK